MLLLLSAFLSLIVGLLDRLNCVCVEDDGAVKRECCGGLEGSENKENKNSMNCNEF